MHELGVALAPLGAYKQFILYDKTIDPETGKARKTPISPHTLRPYPRGSNYQTDPQHWTDADTACQIATAWPDVGVGFMITGDDPFFLFDIDGAWNGSAWSDHANHFCQVFQGAAVEVSNSGTGLHIIGVGTPPEHKCKNVQHHLELYHEARYVALTGNNATGSAGFDCSTILPWLVENYFQPGASGVVEEWTHEPVEGYTSTDTDDELIARAYEQTTAAGAFGGGVTFRDLWDCNVRALAVKWPSATDGFDRSQADASLAQHLTFWTGSNCERVRQIMERSALMRDKWARDDYLPRTILRAVGLQTSWFSVGPTGPEGLGAIKGPSPKQNEYAERVRAQIMHNATPDQIETLAGRCSPGFWIDNADRTAEDLVEATRPMTSGAFEASISTEPVMRAGYQFMTLDLQLEYFAGFVYVMDLNQLWWAKTGEYFKREQFDNYFGGYDFQLDHERNRKTKKPWDAFVGSQAIRWPRVSGSVFRPDLPAGQVVTLEGRHVLNVYIPVETPRQAGDPSPFLLHLQKLVPDERDRTILLSYMAACIQYKGHKFQWAPLIQGVQGNGKTLLTRCVEQAIGRRYCRRPRAKDIDGQFNSWLLGRLFVGVEDIHIPDAKRDALEALKPMITNGESTEIERKGQDASEHDICANFMFNCNGKDGVRKTRDDRRFAPFHTAQQRVEDLERDGMDPEYFATLYDWLKKHDGYAIVHDFLANYQIPVEFNPAVEAGGMATRAPITSSTLEAVEQGLGVVEQSILEAIEEGRPGFKGGWVSSVALEHLLRDIRKAEVIKPNNRRSILEDLGFVQHPRLRQGRATRTVALDGGRKPRLYVKKGHLALNIENPGDVTAQYEQAQAVVGDESEAARAFK